MGQPDHWGDCRPENGWCDTMDYQEFSENRKGETFGRENIIIFEPCNYVSNIAYYHATTRICDYPDFTIDKDYQIAMKRSFMTLTIGSAFWHGSQTALGYIFDNNFIVFTIYVAHQASFSFLPYESPILTDLSLNKRNTNSIQII